MKIMLMVLNQSTLQLKMTDVGEVELALWSEQCPSTPEVLLFQISSVSHFSFEMVVIIICNDRN